MLPYRLFLALALLFLCAASGAAQTFGGTKVVETGVSYPGAGTFTNITGPPSIAGATTAFVGNMSSPPIGVYTASGGTVTPIATTATPVPGGSGNFNTFNAASLGLSSSGVAFLANTGSPNLGVYSTVTGTLAPVANLSTPFPTGGNFALFSVPAVSGNTVAFGGGNNPNPTGIFTKTGTGPIVTVAGTSTPVPGGAGNFTVFIDPFYGPTIPTISGTNVAFNGQGGGRFGVYASISGTVTRIADNTITAPGGTGAFTGFGIAPAISGSQVAFVAQSSGRIGVYTGSGGTVTRVADTTTAAPGGGTFSNFSPVTVALSGGRVVFRAMTSLGQDGIFTDVTGSIQKVIAIGDVIDGRTVTGLATSDFSYTGGDIAVSVAYSGGSAVYRFAPVPEPAGLLALGLAGLAARRVRRRM
jgi:hypothetical protein